MRLPRQLLRRVRRWWMTRTARGHGGRQAMAARRGVCWAAGPAGSGEGGRPMVKEVASSFQKMEALQNRCLGRRGARPSRD